MADKKPLFNVWARVKAEGKYPPTHWHILLDDKTWDDAQKVVSSGNVNSDKFKTNMEYQLTAAGEWPR